MNFLFSVLRWIFSRLDYIVIFVITQLYALLVQIMDTNVFNDLIYKYLGRIYTFLGVFMVFKLSLSVINYVINPDMLSDKGKGFSKVITNVVISLILLAITPNLFNAAFNLQTDILESNAVYQIVTGRKLDKKMTDADSDFNPNNQAKAIAYGVYSSFIYKDKGDDQDLTKMEYEAAKCDEGTTGCSNEKCGTNPYCLVAADTVTKEGENGKDFANAYWFIISTACGGFVAYILLTFCIDASLRAVKLGFLQIIAPIPIMSMIDPKVGTEKVKKWGKECLMTFIDLFIKLAGLFFAVDVITTVISDNNMVKYSDGTPIKNPFVQLFIIIGCLMFAKKLPSMLESILGIKLSGGDGFSLKKKLGGVPGVAAVAGVGALGAKKLVAGVDSARAGKGFWNGTKNVQGNGFISKMQKGWRDMNPNRAEYLKSRKSAKENISVRTSDMAKGKALYDAAGGNDANLKFSDPYRASYDDVNAKKKAMYKANNEVESARAALAAAQNHGTAADIAAAEKRMSEANKNAGSAQKIYEMAKANHEDMQKIYVKDAEMERQFDLYSKTEGSASSPSPSSPSPSPAPTPEHGPNGKGDPVPGRPNPNTGRKKQERRKNN